MKFRSKDNIKIGNCQILNGINPLTPRPPPHSPTRKKTVSTLGKTLSTLEISILTFVFSKVLTVFSPPAGIFPSPRCRCPAKHIPAAGSHRTSALRDNKAGTLLIYIIQLLNRRKEMHHRHGLQPDCNSFSIILQPTGNDRGKE